MFAGGLHDSPGFFREFAFELLRAPAGIAGKHLEAQLVGVIFLGHAFGAFRIAQENAGTDFPLAFFGHPIGVAMQKQHAFQFARTAQINGETQFLRLDGTIDDEAEGAVGTMLRVGTRRSA